MARARTDLAPYMNSISDIPLLTREEERRLGRLSKIQGPRLDGQPVGTDARQELVVRNTRLVVRWAKYYSRASGVELADLIGAGNCGLIRAADRFDPERGHRFSTYASVWVRQHMMIEIKERFLIHVPYYCQTAVNHDGNTRRDTSQDLINAAKKVMEGLQVGDRDNITALDLMECATTNDEERMDGSERVAVRRLMSTLSYRERRVVEMTVVNQIPYVKVGELFGVCKERVRQIRFEAMKKLRRAARAQQTT